MAELKLRMVVIEAGTLKRAAERLIGAKEREVRERVECGEKEIGIGEALAEGNGYGDGVMDLMREILEGEENMKYGSEESIEISGVSEKGGTMDDGAGVKGWRNGDFDI